MATQKRDVRPENVQRRFPNSAVPLVNGKILVQAAKRRSAMIMAANMRCRLPVEGIVLASMAAQAPVMYEIAKSELTYTEFKTALRAGQQVRVKGELIEAALQTAPPVLSRPPANPGLGRADRRRGGGGTAADVPARRRPGPLGREQDHEVHRCRRAVDRGRLSDQGGRVEECQAYGPGGGRGTRQPVRLQPRVIP